MSDSEQIIKKFSTHIFLKDEQKRIRAIYINEPHLKSIMEYLVASDPELNKEDWGRYFLKVLIETKKNYQIVYLTDANNLVYSAYLIYLRIFCQNFLFAYLQRLCLEAAKKISDNYKAASNVSLHYPVEDCFVIAVTAALNPAKFFKNFNFDLASSIEGYARNTLKRIIKNQIAKELKSKSLKFSHYGLLRSLTKTELEKALCKYGIKRNYIELYYLAWQSFKDLFEEIYPPTSSDGSRRKNPPTTPPNDQQLNQIAARYNQQLQRLELQSQPVNGQDIQKILDKCIQAARNYQNESVVSLDFLNEVKDESEAKGESEVKGGRADEILNPLEEAIESEEQDNIAQLKTILLHEFETLDTLAQKSLKLWLGLGINQKDFLSLLNLQKQYQVSRQFDRYLQTILKAVFNSAYRENLWIETPSETDIHRFVAGKINEIKDYLRIYWQNYFMQFLDQILMQEISREEKRLISRYLPVIDNQIRAKIRSKSQNISLRSDEVAPEVIAVKKKIEQKFINYVEESLQVQLADFRSSEQSVRNITDKWLQQNQATLLGLTDTHY